MYVQFFPIYGLTFGINYWDTDMKTDDDPHPDDLSTEYLIQVFFGIIGLSIHWWND